LLIIEKEIVSVVEHKTNKNALHFPEIIKDGLSSRQILKKLLNTILRNLCKKVKTLKHDRIYF